MHKTPVTNKRGFTLIELLIVIAIIGILAAIAIPAFLGQRDKAKHRALEASCQGMVSELQVAFDNHVSRTAMVFLTSPSLQTCYEWEEAPASTKCSTLYPDITSTVTYSRDFKDIMTAIMIHHNIGKEEKNPYDGSALVNAASGPTITPRPRHVLIQNTSEHNASVYGFADTGYVICNIPVSAR